ncbi:hypothetical protein TNIN_415261 [Trichonephila inaurata madagascariensis]|uniref:Uncharacterized protein n=1 Tax=Trichonephila inaurata madagascariensis TaxID=2747483 RepID=A0A8X6YPP6_9ARAC|nr:hypothetical protein TNIN_415261 [Trichonephila inaurata madagascariensis]
MQWLHERTRPCNDIPVRSESCRKFLSWCKLDPMHRKLPWHNVLEKRKHEHSPRRARISKVYERERTKFPDLLPSFRYPRSSSRPPITQM